MCIYKTFCTARIEARIAKAVMYMNIYCIVYFYWFKYMHVYSFIYIQLSARHESRRSFEAAPLSSFSKQITNRGEICSFEEQIAHLKSSFEEQRHFLFFPPLKMQLEI